MGRRPSHVRDMRVREKLMQGIIDTGVGAADTLAFGQDIPAVASRP